MTDWTPPPDNVTWTLAKPISVGSMMYPTITLRAPTVGEVMKATAVQGASGFEVTMRLISATSAEQVAYEALLNLPAWVLDQMSKYMDSFAGMPMPYPLAPAAPPVAPAS